MKAKYIISLSGLTALVLIWLAIVGLARAGTPVTGSEPGKSSPECGPNWQVVSSPNIGTGDNKLAGVDAALIGGDVWAAGTYWDESALKYKTLIERESGGQWNVVSSPNQGTEYNWLEGVADVYANDAWAVGYYGSTQSPSIRTLTERWNGTQWSIVSSPNPGSSSNYLNAVTINAPTDAWAAGFYSNGSGYRTLIEHWNGSQWSVSPSPNVGTGDNELWKVAVVSANNVWAVGWYNNGTADRTLALHWNGSTWSTVTTPNANGSTSDNHLRSVTVISANDIWAVGYYYHTVLGKDQTLILHWNGTAWSIVASPNASPSSNYLYAVEKASANDIWAAGHYFDLNSNKYQTLIEHWNGSGWSVVPSPNLGTSFHNELYDVAVVSASEVWAVGNQGDDLRTTLTEEYNPCTGTATPTNGPRQTDTSSPSPTSTRTSLPTQTPGGPSATPIPTNTPTATPTNTPPNTATGTPSATPTHCAIQFADVQQGSTFYPYIHCLACNGIVSGYACGGTGELCNPAHDPYFRPNANVTRGQIAKFISNAAGYNDSIPVNRQTFTDVPYHSTYWLFVERVYLHGIISGYTDPLQCLRIGVPCFHPESNVKRGQAAKFASNAAGYNDNIPPNQQTFDDVPYSHPFWLYIERIYLHGIMYGYPPCEQDGIPCFKPDNHVTRGQTAKIVSRSFFPNCSNPSGKENDPTLQR